MTFSPLTPVIVLPFADPRGRHAHLAEDPIAEPLAHERTIVVHGVEEELCRLEEACLLSGDVENAFNSVDRGAMLEAVAAVSPQLAAAAFFPRSVAVMMGRARCSATSGDR